MTRVDFGGRLFVVTGASSGLGRAIAYRLAQRHGAPVVVVARRGDLLRELQLSISHETRTSVHVIEMDLSQPEALERLHKEASSIGPVFGLVNAAGVTQYGSSIEAEWQALEAVQRIDLSGLMRLCLLFGRDMSARGTGAILNVTSMAAFVPVPYQAVYTACKQGAHGFSLALGAELRRRGVLVCALAPGGMDTDMIDRAGLQAVARRHKGSMMSADRVAEIGLRALSRGKAVCVPGGLNRIGVALSRWIPARWLADALERVYRPDPPENIKLTP